MFHFSCGFGHDGFGGAKDRPKSANRKIRRRQTKLHRGFMLKQMNSNQSSADFTESAAHEKGKEGTLWMICTCGSVKSDSRSLLFGRRSRVRIATVFDCQESGPEGDGFGGESAGHWNRRNRRSEEGLSRLQAEAFIALAGLSCLTVVNRPTGFPALQCANAPSAGYRTRWP